jgi:geranylgeranyl diphosphate synthase type I
LGIAFQLADDVLGVFGNEEQTGKSNSNDLREGKRTLLAQITSQRLIGEQQKLFKQLFGKPDLDGSEAAELRRQIVDCGAKAEVEAQIAHYRSKVVETLDSLDVSDAARSQLKQLVSWVTERQS